MLFALIGICPIWGKIDFLVKIGVFKNIFLGSLLLMDVYLIILRSYRLVFDLVCLRRCRMPGGGACVQGSVGCKRVFYCLAPEKSLSV